MEMKATYLLLFGGRVNMRRVTDDARLRPGRAETLGISLLHPSLK